MKRLHVHIAVDDLEKSIGFYSTLFARAPSEMPFIRGSFWSETRSVSFASQAASS